MIDILPGVAAAKALVGKDAGWLLTFHKERKNTDFDPEVVLEIGRDDYDASLRASLPSGLEGGVYSFVVEGMIDDHYASLTKAHAEAPGLVVQLYLYWRDTNQSLLGYATNLGGLTDVLGGSKANKEALVAVLSVTKLSRKAGSRRYEVTIEARERVFHLLERRRLWGATQSDTPLKTIEAIAKEIGVKVHPHEVQAAASGMDLGGLVGAIAGAVAGVVAAAADAVAGGEPGAKQGTDEPPPKSDAEKGRTGAAAVLALAGRLEEIGRDYGRGMLLIRDGELHAGKRPIPTDAKDPTKQGTPKDLTLGTGLFEVEPAGKVQIDPGWDAYAEENRDKEPPTRDRYKLTLRGRPDIKPGDVVRFELPKEETASTTPGAEAIVAAVSSVAGVPVLPDLGQLKDPVSMYVETVEHRLARTAAFMTTLVGVVVPPDAPWDKRTPVERAADVDDNGAATGEDRVKKAIDKRHAAALDQKRFSEVGEVRAVATSGQKEPPSQTETVWRGLNPGDGHPNQARRLGVRRPTAAEKPGVPYATPFAWGKCGLVLPRYPGTRVVLTHRNGERDDPIDIGALWESGHGPDSQAGDWWLILPVDLDNAKRSSLGEKDAPQEHKGSVTNDLIDAEGNRVIEVGQLTIRVGNVLQEAGKRPAHGVQVQHKSNSAQVVISEDGAITIRASKNIEIKTDGDITLDANKVNVKVKSTMDVS